MYVQHFKSHLCYIHPISFIISIHLVLLLINIPVYHAQADYGKYYSECSKNTSFKCGETTLYPKYPFWVENIRPSYCGLKGFHLSCENNEIPVTDFGSGNKYRVANFTPYWITLKHYDFHLHEDVCAFKLKDTKLNSTLFENSPGVEDFYMFYGCPLGLNIWDTIGIYNYTCTSGEQVIYGGQSLLDDDHLKSLNTKCKTFTRIPVDWIKLEKFSKNLTVLLEEILKSSFDIHYKISNACYNCRKSGGECWNGTDVGVDPPCLHKPDNGVSCIFKDECHAIILCHSPGNTTQLTGNTTRLTGNTTGKKIGIVGAAGGGILLLLLVFLILYRRKKSKHISSGISPNISSHSFSMPDSEKEGTYAGVPTFPYSDLEKATNYFDSGYELGNGGFGTVYKGRLRDGREVAVKRLYDNNFKRVEQFMNEIVILAGLHHPNLVVLYGSTSHQCKTLLLVYEYIPNGTVADHLHGDGAQPGSLGWKTRMSIAIETASALSYLHASDVIHRDVKTTNILLDNNFGVKVADFGLSRLFPGNVTHVSTVPQGTPGYVDPEYHQCYQLTDKSDVYSFGVVLIELISSKPAVDISRHRHEINLANLAINKIQGDALHELVDPTLGFEWDDEVRNMIGGVAELAFRCLQNEREMRPSMEEVHKSLKEITMVKQY